VGWLRKRRGDAGRRDISPGEADVLVRGGALALDVREPAEWQAGHVPGARHLPLGQLEGGLHALPRDRRLVVVCRSGNRSATATDLLIGSGFDAVNLGGGMRAWAAAGLPIEANGARPGTVV
jgi:rhodanese-related sulfurtransferase